MSLERISPQRSSYYDALVPDFLRESSSEILGIIAANSTFAIEPTQRNAWIREIQILKSALADLDGRVLLEFIVPRIGSRIDAILLSAGKVFVLEFKVGQSDHTTKDLIQSWDYALDLKNFHSGSHAADVIPILIATETDATDYHLQPPHSDGVFPPSKASPSGLRALIDEGLSRKSDQIFDQEAWSRTPYRPTPTILEAARRLFAGHSVDAIARNDAGTQNLGITSKRVEEIVDAAKKDGAKALVLVTGVPGAGKTLVGLTIATLPRTDPSMSHGTFLSGNGPLVAVLSHALARDERQRLQDLGVTADKSRVKQTIKAFIHNVHHFRDAGLKDDGPPSDHVVIFDEAQRAWNKAKTADFMKKRKGKDDFTQSEPEFLISYLDRHVDWAVVVCLVGGGQEIGQGEAGIGAWLDAVREQFPHWHIHLSSELTDSEYAATGEIQALDGRSDVHIDKSLHLSVPMRSFRSEHVSRFVKAVLDCEQETARHLFSELSPSYSITLTRSLDRAKRWVREKARGSERVGLVASSKAARLKPHAIDVRAAVNPVHYFLGNRADTRSSFYLEDAASEFQVQGLELDWVCLTWDADLRFNQAEWGFHEFRGSKWNRVKSEVRQQYLLNAYRVLLTRARQGMVIFVPPGDPTDPTRPPKYYDHTYAYLRDAGLEVLDL